MSFNKPQLASPVVQLPAAEDHPTAQELPLHPGFALQFNCVLHGLLHTSFRKDAGQKVAHPKYKWEMSSGLLHPQVCLDLWGLPVLHHGGAI